MKRIWFAGAALLVWQMCSMGFGLVEFMYDRPAPVAAILATSATALAWIALAAWAGYRHHTRFGLAAAILWIAITAVLLLAMLTRAIEADDGVAPWHRVLLLLLVLAGGPLYSLGSLIPVEDSLLGTTMIAVFILAVMAVTYMAGRRLGGRRNPIHPANTDSISEPR